MKRMYFNLYNGIASKTVFVTMERAMDLAREEVLGGASYVRLSVKYENKYITLGTYFPTSDPYKYEKTWPGYKYVDSEPILPKIAIKARKRPNFGVSFSD